VPDDSQLQLRPKDRDSALSLSKASSQLITRGRRDAAMLASRWSSTVIKARAGVICETCGERKENTAPSDDFCHWCRPREQEIAEIWDWWGFDRWGRPQNKLWDHAAQWRDYQAKLEIDGLLQQMRMPVRWIELWWGFGATEYDPIRRGQAQALSVAKAVNDRWGFDREGNPANGDWDQEVRWRATFALEELKRILARLGLPLPDDWPDV
jgi:hypothetical protein